ncbi:hypothetical protein [Neolewinella antarctica]|uniref:Uncharacterized protein n=1 Tax=Neolewinella antarctica TaxID=442734 RepID=A0ABX0XCW2_9BACT|nr:hypothetical protein [Neolewinella antarctica]NJC27128.1 hypothetical protein [Neolewinella antarctica]
MIKESTIERVLDRLESGVDEYEQEIQDFAESQPHLMAYVANEDNEVFQQEELALLLFGTLAVYQSVTDELTEPEVATPEQIEAADDANYAVVNAIKGSFRAKLDPFFAKTKQEDLLAFIEDLVSAEAEAEEEGITKEAREPLFVTLKTVVDVLTRGSRG